MSKKHITISIALYVFLLAAIAAPLLPGQNPPAPPAQDERVQLAEAKVALARRALEHVDQMFRTGRSGTEGYLLRVTWNRRLLDARLTSTNDVATKIKAAEEYVAECRVMRTGAKAAYESGVLDNLSVMQLEWSVLEGETILADLRGGQVR